MNSTPQFSVHDGQIYDPSGALWKARGINIGIENMGDADKMLADMPGLNFVRLAVETNKDPSQLPDPSVMKAFIDKMTARGIVVEIEDHPWGNDPNNPQPPPYTGQQLATEAKWYADVAAMYKDNPYVWEGTMNEPESGAGMQAQVVATYDAIRATGNTNIMMFEAGLGGGNPGTVGDGGGYGGAGSGYTAGPDFLKMTNVVEDLHFYAWATGNSQDPTAVLNYLKGSAASHVGVDAAQTIKSADGIIPVIIAETGISSGQGADGAQVIQAAFNNNFTSGAAAWAWYPIYQQAGVNPTDIGDLVDSNGNLSSYGQTIASYIAHNAGPAQVSTVSVKNVTTDAAPQTIDAQDYHGPVAHITSQYAAPITLDTLNITANAPNMFIQLGVQGQSNAEVGSINVSKANGNNILDSYANSTFYTGGSGVDQFYDDARGAVNSWSTVANFHTNDNVTMWGIKKSDFTLHWIGDTQGAAGFTGLTGVAVSNDGQQQIAVTMAGYSMADLTNGRLSVNYVNSGASSTPYLSIHAN